MMGANGKQVVIDGERQFMTFGDAFQADALEMDMKLSVKRFQQRQRPFCRKGKQRVFDATKHDAGSHPRTGAWAG